MLRGTALSRTTIHRTAPPHARPCRACCQNRHLRHKARAITVASLHPRRGSISQRLSTFYAAGRN
ncbi:hypothetical protein CSR02_10190 [Acetobacter pomorum]|uniref:Uncharacterized protein n=1 Tax=Acetobacter pomorum TaxID=65959 RepID=A0A2G4R9W7_9PROT|nr:hypothetical protein CSR02_10190 [Acetobacter pomorum]